jgi:hypothetical protein
MGVIFFSVVLYELCGDLFDGADFLKLTEEGKKKKKKKIGAGKMKRAHSSSALTLNGQEVKPYAHTDVICTIGPVSNSVDTLEKLMRAGLAVVRLNFSHGTHQFHGSIIANAREAAKRVAPIPIAIALDTKGQ